MQQQLTQSGLDLVNQLSSRYNLSYDAVLHMLIAVNNGGGTMAQFNCPELGGGGQWMQGGMTMVGDMFNHGLQMTVDNLCSEISNGLASTQVFPPAPRGTGSNNWWPPELGSPSSSGAQNNIRYAVFPNRLAVEFNGQITIYDTLNHNIGGVSQQQGGDTSLTFSSQFGTVAVNSLPVISGLASEKTAPQTNFVDASLQSQESIPNQDQATPEVAGNNESADGLIGLLKKLGELRDVGVLTDEEFNAKKTELLNRL